MNAPRLIGPLGLALCLGIFVGGQAQAQDQLTKEELAWDGPRPTKTLGIDEVLNSVATHFPALLAAQKKREAAQGKVLKARGAYDPKLKADGAITTGAYYDLRRADVELSQQTPVWGSSLYGGYRFGRGVDPDQRFPSYYEDQTLEGGEFRVGIKVPLLQNGFIDVFRARRKQAIFEAMAADEKVRETLLKTQTYAAYAYWKWVEAAYKLEASAGLLALANQRQVQIEAQVQAGSRPMFDSIDNQRIVYERRRDWAESMRTKKVAWLSLSLFLRDSEGKMVKGRFAAPPIDTIAMLPKTTSLEVACHPSIVLAERTIDSQRVAEDLASNRRLPKLDVAVELSRDLGQGGPVSLPGTVLMGKVSFELPVLLRKGRGDYAYERSTREAMENELFLARNELTISVKRAFTNLSWFNKETTYDQKFTAAAKRVLEGERERFKAGAGTLITLNIREQNLGKAQKQYATSYATYAMARSQWTILEELLSGASCKE